MAAAETAAKPRPSGDTGARDSSARESDVNADLLHDDDTQDVGPVPQDIIDAARSAR